MSRLVAVVALILLLSACSRPSTPPPPGDPTPVRYNEPRLLLDLALGDSPDQPGRTPSRVGGVGPKGPLGLAVTGSGEIYLLDQAKGRVLVYVDGRLHARIPTPWLDDEGVDLRLEPEGMVVAGSGREYRLAGGRIAEMRATAPGPAHGGEGPILPGTALAEVPLPAGVEVVDRYITPEGGVYALAWRWGSGQIDRALVYEMLPPAGRPTRAAPAPEPAPPVLFNRPVPSKVRLVAPDWVPLEVTDPVALWNLWRLLATAGPAHRPLAIKAAKLARLEATFVDGQPLVLDLYGDLMAVAGSLYRVEAADALRRQVGALLLSPEGLAAALQASRRADLVMTDVPGVSQSLTAAQRQQLTESLREVIPVHPHAMAQPLEAPFPRYAIRLEGMGWEGSLMLQGDHHLSRGSGGAVAHPGRLAGLVRQWLPVPDFKPGEVAYLYLADRVEIGEGVDITRWKNTIVRHLLQVTPLDAGSPWKGAVTFTFHVKGVKQVVTVDARGFTYAGQRYEVPGLNHLIYLQGVP